MLTCILKPPRHPVCAPPTQTRRPLCSHPRAQLDFIHSTLPGGNRRQRFVDFGKLKFLKVWIDTHLDHACLLNEDDPEKDGLLEQFGHLQSLRAPQLLQRGLVRAPAHDLDTMVRTHSEGRVWITAVEIEEDTKNSARHAIR